MRAVPVVAMKPGLEMGGAMGRVGVDGRIGPFAQRGLDKAFGFAVGAWSVGAGKKMAQAVALTSGAEEMGTIAGAIIAHDPLSFDA